MTNQWSIKLPTEPGWYWCSGGTDREPSPMRVVWHCEKLQVIIDGLGFRELQHCESWSWIKMTIPHPPDASDVRQRESPELWATTFSRQIADAFSNDRGDIELCNDLCKEAGQRRTSVWQNGWNMAWTHAYIAVCSILETEYSHPDSMLLRWVGIEVAASWPQESVVLRRWKSRETNQWNYAVCELRSEWGYGAESQFLMLERSCDAEA